MSLRSIISRVFFTLIFCFQPFNASIAAGVPALPITPSIPSVVSDGSIYYVNKDTGNDSISPTEAKNPATPWASIQEGISNLKAGDSLIISKSSTPYKERVIVDIAGTGLHWIAIKGADGETPVVNGFILGPHAQHIKLSNFRLIPEGPEATGPESQGIYVYRGAHDFFFENLEIDGLSRARRGIQIGQHEGAEQGAYNGYLKNITIHHTLEQGVYILANTENIVFEDIISRNSLKGDGFSGISIPGDTRGQNSSFFFINSMAYENAGDGFDIGAGVQQVFSGCTSHSNGGVQGVGFKVWGGTEPGGHIWLVNNLAYGNDYSALDIKNVSDATIYLLHNTFVGNGVHSGGVEFRTVNDNPANAWSDRIEMGIPKLFLYNNLIYSNANPDLPVYAFYNQETIIVESDCNYIVATQSNRFCRMRNAKKEVIGELSLESMSGEADPTASKTSCGYLSEMAEGRSLILKAIGKNDPYFTDFPRNNYSVSEKSPAFGKGCSIGIEEDIKGRMRLTDTPTIGAFEQLQSAPSPPIIEATLGAK